MFLIDVEPDHALAICTMAIYSCSDIKSMVSKISDMPRRICIVTGCLLLLMGCGKWPPIATTAEDIQRIPADEASVRMRALADKDIPALTHFKHLKILDFEGGWAVEDARLTDAGLKTLAGLELHELTNLSLGYNHNITDAGLSYLVPLDSIKWLGLANVPGISDAELTSIAKMTNLEGLDIRGCTRITDAGLGTIASMQYLTVVLLDGCTRVTPAGVAALAEELPQARIIKIDK